MELLSSPTVVICIYVCMYVCMYQIMLCNLNLHDVICQLYLTKAEGKITRSEGGRKEKISEEMSLQETVFF